MRQDKLRSKHVPTTIRILVVGASQTGKSAVSVRFMTRRYIGEYQQNVEQVYKRDISYGNDVIRYELKDISGIIGIESHLPWATCVAVVYAIDDRASFLEVDHIFKCIESYSEGRALNCVLIANKNDLEHLRIVTSEEGKAMANEHKVSFWETSAAEDYHSTYAPFSSLILESYTNIESDLHVDRMCKRKLSSFTSPINEKYRSESDENLLGWGSLHEEDTLSISSTKSARERRPNRLSLMDSAKRKDSVGTNSTDSSCFDTNNNLDVQYGSDENSRSNSFSKRELSRSSLRRNEKKAATLRKSGMSRSFSDLQELSNKKDESPNNLLSVKADEKALTSSYTKLPSPNPSSKGWGKIKRDKNKIIESQNNNNDEQTKSKKSDSKKSVRRKFSTIFKPKIQIESPE